MTTRWEVLLLCLLGIVLTGFNTTESFVVPLSRRYDSILGRKHALLPHHATRKNDRNDDDREDASASPSAVVPTTVNRTRRPPRIRRTVNSKISSVTPLDSEQKNSDSAIDNQVDDDDDNDNNDSSTTSAISTHFSSRSDIHPLTKRALDEVLHLTTMTPIQYESYSAILEGKNVLAQSKTGSGKTLAYLIPSLQRILNGDVPWHAGRSVAIVVLSPTRELAIQIADQAEALLTFHNTKSSSLFTGRSSSGSSSGSGAVACLYGGVKMARDRRLLSGRNGLPAVVIATPGRLLQHLDDTRLDDGRKFCDVVDETQIVVLDETDRLLEAFPHETKRILSFLARADKRQNLLFSATFPRTLRETLMAGDTAFVKGDIVEISCSDNSNTNDRHKQRAGDHHRIEDKSTSNNSQSSIDQSYVIMDDIESQYIELLLAILRREISNSPQDYKIIVFFPTGRLVRFMYQFFSSPGVQLEKIWEIHSRMSQSSRNRSSDGFRKARKGILFSSDVSQRGLDYPDVSLVVQYGAPRSRNDYVHRLGRTGRAGKAGKGVLVSMPFERDARSRRGIKLDKEAEAWLQHDNKISDQTYHDVLKQCRQDIESLRWKVRSQHATLTPYAESAVTSFLAHYLPRGRRRGADETRNSFNLDGRKALEYAKDFAKALGLNELPELDPRLQERLEG